MFFTNETIKVVTIINKYSCEVPVEAYIQYKNFIIFWEFI